MISMEDAAERCYFGKSPKTVLTHHSYLLPVSSSSFFQHPFVSQPLSRTLAIELLDKANNPDHSTFNDFDDDDPEPEVNFDPLRFRFAFKTNVFVKFVNRLT